MNRFPEAYKLSRLTQEEIENLDKPIRNWMCNENLPTKKNLGPDGLISEFYQALK